MQNLAQLQNGELIGTKRLKLSCKLTLFPIEIFSLADSLEILDLSQNQLSHLPEGFEVMKKLKIVFLSDNLFDTFPIQLANSPALEMIGIKANQISIIPENAFPPKLRWLILTDNQIEELPKSIGNCPNMQKLMLAGNKLIDLPIELAQCQNLELLRISANDLSEIPTWLLQMPKLSWLALAGNPLPFLQKMNLASITKIDFEDLYIDQLIGEGASGKIYQSSLKNNDEDKLALKIYKGAITSDGYPQDEIKASVAAPQHPNILAPIGLLINHPDENLGLIFRKLPNSISNLGLPPSFDSCTRDNFEDGKSLDSKLTFQICEKMAEIGFQLHQNGILHGDLYAHNTLIDDQNHITFGDFGAAGLYDTRNQNLSIQLQKIEIRSYGSFVDDLLTITTKDLITQKLEKIRDLCYNPIVNQRPIFEEIMKIYQSI